MYLTIEYNFYEHIFYILVEGEGIALYTPLSREREIEMNPEATALRCFGLVALKPLTPYCMFTQDQLTAARANFPLYASVPDVAFVVMADVVAYVATLPAAAPVAPVVDGCAALRAEMDSVASFVTAQQGKRGGVQPLPFGPYQSNLDGETGLPAMIGLNKATGKGEERTYNGSKYNVALYFALTGGPVGATVGGRVSHQMLADFPALLVKVDGQPLAVSGTFGVTVKSVDGRRVGTLHTDATAYADALAS